MSWSEVPNSPAGSAAGDGCFNGLLGPAGSRIEVPVLLGFRQGSLAGHLAQHRSL